MSHSLKNLIRPSSTAQQRNLLAEVVRFLSTSPGVHKSCKLTIVEYALPLCAAICAQQFLLGNAAISHKSWATYIDCLCMIQYESIAGKAKMQS